MTCQCVDCRFTHAADEALDTGVVVELDDIYMVVPDTIMAEAAANGLETPDTYRAVRGDGRTVWIYRRQTPTEVARTALPGPTLGALRRARGMP
ncbi:MAG TPA: hypothetical protein VFH36_22525 [Acidimicrobiales bacterium]|nr:hypothetical protein [Acidimicrobiales bacterium]